jgi:hypothetical protein
MKYIIPNLVIGVKLGTPIEFQTVNLTLTFSKPGSLVIQGEDIRQWIFNKINGLILVPYDNADFNIMSDLSNKGLINCAALKLDEVRKNIEIGLDKVYTSDVINEFQSVLYDQLAQACLKENIELEFLEIS